MKIVQIKSTENCHFYSREKSLYVAWACFRNGFGTSVSLEVWRCNEIPMEILYLGETCLQLCLDY